MPSGKTELEAEFFTGSNFPGDNLGFNPDPKKVQQKMKRRPASTAPSNICLKSLVVMMNRVSELLNNNKAYTTMVLKTYSKMGIMSNNDVYVALNKTQGIVWS